MVSGPTSGAVGCLLEEACKCGTRFIPRIPRVLRAEILRLGAERPARRLQVRGKIRTTNPASSPCRNLTSGGGSARKTLASAGQDSYHESREFSVPKSYVWGRIGPQDACKCGARFVPRIPRAVRAEILRLGAERPARRLQVRGKIRTTNPASSPCRNLTSGGGSARKTLASAGQDSYHESREFSVPKSYVWGRIGPQDACKCGARFVPRIPRVCPCRNLTSGGGSARKTLASAGQDSYHESREFSVPKSYVWGRIGPQDACKCGARFVPRIPRVLRAEILRLGADRPARRLQVRGKIRTTNPASSPCRNLTSGGGAALKTLASAGQDSYHESREFSVPKSYVWGRSGPQDACKCGARFVPRIPRVLRAEILRLGAERPARRLQVRGKIRTTNPASSPWRNLTSGGERPARRLQVRGKIRTTNHASSPWRNLTSGGGAARKTLASARQDSYHESREFSVPKSYVWGRNGPQDACKCGARFATNPASSPCRNLTSGGGKTLASAGQDSYHESREFSVPKSYVWGRSGPQDACKCGARFVPRIPRVRLRAEILRLGAERPRKTLASAGQDSYHESREFSVAKSYVWGRSGPQDACKCEARFVPRIPRDLRAEILRRSSQELRKSHAKVLTQVTCQGTLRSGCKTFP